MLKRIVFFLRARARGNGPVAKPSLSAAAAQAHARI